MTLPNMPNTPVSTKGRSTDRRRVLKAGIIAYNAGHVTLPCGVRDMSETGARLSVTGSVSAPDTFELIVEVDAVEVPCEVIWRRGQEIGVRFTAQPQASVRKREQIVTQWATAGQKPSLRRKPPVPAVRTRT